MLTYIDGSAQLAGMQSDFSFYLVAVANAGSSVGRIGGGITADKTGPLNVIIPSTLVAGVATYAWPYAASKGAFVVVALIYGYVRSYRNFPFVEAEETVVQRLECLSVCSSRLFLRWAGCTISGRAQATS